MLPEIDEKQYTWQNLMETVTEDCLQDNDLEQVEPFGPSPIQNDYITAATLEQMHQAQGSVLGDWSWVHEEPDWEIWHLDSAPGQVVPASIDEVDFGDLRTSDIKCGADPSIEGLDRTVITGLVIVRGAMTEDEILAIYNGEFNRNAFQLIHVGLCTPSRNPITGGE